MSFNRSLLFGSIGLLIQSQVAWGALSCHEGSMFLGDAGLVHSETEAWSRYELSYQIDEQYWNGVVFEFFSTAPDNSMLDGISPADEGRKLVEKLTRNLQAHMTDASIYQSVSDIQFHEGHYGVITSFNAVFEETTDIYAVHGQWNAGNLYFLRTHAMTTDNPALSEQTAVESLNQMIENCLFHEA